MGLWRKGKEGRREKKENSSFWIYFRIHRDRNLSQRFVYWHGVSLPTWQSQEKLDFTHIELDKFIYFSVYIIS